MYKFHRKIVAVLLLTFAFVVAHDFVLQNQHAQMCELHDADDYDSKIKEQKHDNLHAMFEIAIEPLQVYVLEVKKNSLNSAINSFLTYLIFPLIKPPLI